MMYQIKKSIKNAVGQNTINLFKSLKKRVLRVEQKEAAALQALSMEDQKLVQGIKQANLTYLSYRKLASLVNTCRQIEDSQLEGFFIEAGCALGGSTILISSLKNSERSLFVYDVFGMIPPPTEDDTLDVHDRYMTIVEGKSAGLGGEKYYGYEENLYEIVKSNLLSFGIDCKNDSVFLVKGLIQETMQINQPVAFAHIDVDWYDPVKTCLERIFPLLVIGGSIILDDYFDWGGCKKATDEYLAKVPGQYLLDDSATSLKVTKQAVN